MSRAQWAALAAAGLGVRTILRLSEHLGGVEAIFRASREALLDVRGIGPRTASAILALDLAAIERGLRRIEADGIRVIAWEDQADYPANLRALPADAPPVLYLKGSFLPEDQRVVAIVGTRWPTEPAATLARQMAGELARRGWAIVSGLAAGIDTAAHIGALEAGGRTLAVLGCGVERIYPPENVPLAAQIAEMGAVISEAHPTETVSKRRLVARNRITSGLSRAVIVVEAGEDGGSVITARRAREQGREVFAVRGGDAGCDALIQEGAGVILPDKVDWDALSERLELIVIA